MDLSKQIQSKINLLEAQLKQILESGLFNEKEIERLSQPINIQLGQLHAQKEALELGNNHEGVNNIEVNF